MESLKELKALTAASADAIRAAASPTKLRSAAARGLVGPEGDADGGGGGGAGPEENEEDGEDGIGPEEEVRDAGGGEEDAPKKRSARRPSHSKVAASP